MGFKILKETDDKFTIYNPDTKEAEEHPKVPNAFNRLMEGIKGQGDDPIRNKYMENLAQVRKQKGWIK